MPDGTGGLVVVDRDTCIGSGMCIVYAPHTFAHDEEAKAVVQHPSGDSMDAVRTAVEGCPTGALSLAFDDRSDV
jgi:ferredoxin